MLIDDIATGKILGIETSTLAVWRSTKRYAFPYVKVGRLIRYRESDVEAFIESRVQNGDS